VVNSGKNLIVEDARTHGLVAENLAITDLGVIAYAGAPLRDADGLVLGSLCVIDSKPRKWTKDEIDTLAAIAQQVMTEIALRSAALRQTNANARIRAADEDRRRIARLDRHDLRTPLNALLLNVQAALLLGEVNDEGREFLEAAANNGKAITEMLDQMLDIDLLGFKGAEALTLRACDPARLIAQSLGQVAPLAAEKAISVTTNVESTRSFPGDEEKLVRVLVNLVANAVKFTAGGGRIEISVRDGVLDDKDSICFSVEDSGIGIDDKYLGDIFTEGFRINTEISTRRSTGLGLTFCKRAVAAHSGHIWVESRKGEGSTFSFSIPAGG
jgi:signal transduction histidine kinase